MDDGVLCRVVECAKAYRESYRIKDKSHDDIKRARMVLFLMLDELEGGDSARTRVEPGRSVEEGTGTGPPVDVPSSGVLA